MQWRQKAKKLVIAGFLYMFICINIEAGVTIVGSTYAPISLSFPPPFHTQNRCYEK
jgi:hypothetical protein